MAFRPLFAVVPVALVLTAGLAVLTTAGASNGGADTPELAQTPPPAGAAPMPGDATPSDRPAFSPQKACLTMIAHKAGRLAFLKARLDLKPEQMAAWNAFEKASDDVLAKAKTRCASLPTEVKERPSFTERLTMRENFMKARLDAVEAVKPSLLALYAALTPDQKELFDRPRGMGPQRWHRRWHDHG